MNKINFNQTGGFPLETETLDALQQAYQLFNALGQLAGGRAIISGCQKIGNNIADGVVYLDGELLPFKGGTLQSKVIITDKAISVPFQDGAIRPVYHQRTATFGTGTKAIDWSDFKRLDSIPTIMERIKSLEDKPELEEADEDDMEYETRSNAYVSPRRLKLHNGLNNAILLSGEVYEDGGRKCEFGGYFRSEKLPGTGSYRIHHNLGYVTYGFLGSEISNGRVKVVMDKRYSNYCDVKAKDVGRRWDVSFTFIIFRTA